MTAAAPLARIVLYVETNEKGLDAARYAIALAKRYGADLHAIAVMNDKVLTELMHARVFLKEEGLDIERDLEEDAKRYLAFVEKLAGQKDLRIATHLLRGDVHQEVLAKARELQASLLVIGEIEEFLSRRDCTFSESEQIITTAECPVLVVKGKRFVKDCFDAV